MKCWKCGQHGDIEKDCKNVAPLTDEKAELYDENVWTNDGTEYYDENWMDWTGALTDWSTYTQKHNHTNAKARAQCKYEM